MLLYIFSFEVTLCLNDIGMATFILNEQPSCEEKRKLILSAQLSECSSKQAVELVLHYVDMKDIMSEVLDEWREKKFIPREIR